MSAGDLVMEIVNQSDPALTISQRDAQLRSMIVALQEELAVLEVDAAVHMLGASLLFTKSGGSWGLFVRSSGTTAMEPLTSLKRGRMCAVVGHLGELFQEIRDEHERELKRMVDAKKMVLECSKAISGHQVNWAQDKFNSQYQSAPTLGPAMKKVVEGAPPRSGPDDETDPVMMIANGVSK